MNQLVRYATRFLAITLGVCAAGGAVAQTTPELPSVKVDSATLLSPSAASTYYSSSVTHSFGPGSEYVAGNRPVEVRELARALRYDADLIYEFVRDKIEITPLYGLQKGALGTLVDRYGTAFDQAHLMVELLKEADTAAGTTFAPTYKVGTVTHSVEEVARWLGLIYFDGLGNQTWDATAVTNALADGGFPATVSGSTVTMSHVWVGATIGGTEYVFDPAYKLHTFYRGLDLATAMGYGGAASFLATATSATVVGTEAGAPTARVFNKAGVESSLGTYAQNLINTIRTSHPSASLKEIAGGSEVIDDVVPTGGSRVTALAYQVTTSSPWPSGIPDQYRTRFTVQIIDGVTTLVNKTFYVDEVYGRRMMTTVHSSLTGNTANQATDAVIDLQVDGVTVATGVTNKQRNALDDMDMVVDVDHPYAANSGAYMDQAYRRKNAGLASGVAITHGWGHVSATLMSKLTGERLGDEPQTAAGSCGDPLVGPEPFTVELTAESRHRLQMGYGWLAQFSSMSGLQSEATTALSQHHHSIGLVTSVSAWINPCDGIPSMEGNFGINRNQNVDQIDMITGISVTSKASDSVGQQATARALALGAATLEGSMYEQYQDKVEASSTTSRFDWANDNQPGERFILADSTTYAAVKPTIGDGDAFRGPVQGKIQEYIDAGYRVLMHEDTELGPGSEAGANTGLDVSGNPVFDVGYDRGGSFVAYQPTTGNIAHIVFSGVTGAKGGGASDDTTEDQKFDPSKVADILKDEFKDRTRLHGVDLKTGDLSYSAPADITVGAGDFPNTLSFQRSFNAGGVKSQGLGAGWTHNWDISLSTSGSGLEAMGASSALNATASLVAFVVAQDLYKGDLAISTATLERLVVPHFVANWWRQNLTFNAVSVRQGTSTTQFVRLPNGQWNPPLGSNATLTTTGQRLVSSSIPDPAQGNKFPQGVIRATLPIDAQRWDADKPTYDYRNLQFTLTDGDGNSQTFKHRDILAGETAWSVPTTCGNAPCLRRKDMANAPTFAMTDWNFKSGASITIAYDSTARPYQITNNFGRSINLSWSALTFLESSRIILVTAVGASGGRQVSFTYAKQGREDFRQLSAQPGTNLAESANQPQLVSATSPAGEVSEYHYVGDGVNSAAYDDANDRDDWFARLYQVIDPLNMAKALANRSASLQVTYDNVWNAATFRDATALREEKDLVTPPRGAWQFFIAEGHRGERQDPLGGLLTAYYDIRGNLVEQIDEAGRSVVSTYDTINRVSGRTMPEGNQVLFAYENLWGKQFNVSQLRKVAKAGSGLADVVASAAYADANWPNKPTSVTDFNGNTTDLAYDANGNIVTATLPPVLDGVSGTANVRPVHRFAYNATGQLFRSIDPTGLVTVMDFDAAGNPVKSVTDCGNAAATTTAQCAGGAMIATVSTYDAVGDVISVDGPRTDVVDVTTMEYDAMRRETAMVDAALGRTELTYDANGRTVKQVAAVGGPLAQVSEMTWTPTGKEARLYNPYSPPLGQALGAEGWTDNFYDDLDRLVGSEVEMGAGVNNRKTRMVFDIAGQLIQEVRAFQGDLSLKSVINSLSPIACADGVAIPQCYAAYAYTANGQQASVMDANANVTRYSYDGFDRLARTDFPSKARGTFAAPNTDNGTDYETLSYDAAGNVTARRTRRGDIIASTYDALGRVIGKTPGTDAAVAYQYDLAGRQTRVAFADGSYSIDHAYDGAGRRIQTTNGWALTGGAAVSRVFDLTYDTASNLVRFDYPDAYYVSQSFDVLGRPDIIRHSGTTIIRDFDYDALSRRSRAAATTALVTTYSYAGDGALASLNHSIATGFMAANYSFTYTLANQVSGRTVSDATFIYSQPLDKVENYETTADATKAANGLNQYEVIRQGALSFTLTHDAAGNLTGDGTWVYTYDVENRLIRADGPATSAVYLYDPLGRRYRKCVVAQAAVAAPCADAAALATDTAYDGDNAMADYDGIDGALVYRYVHGPATDEIIAWWDSGKRSGTARWAYPVTDHLGSTVLTQTETATGAAGILDRFSYSAYGEVSDPTGYPFKFTGRKFDAETNLYYYRARYYSPTIGRFLQTDPIGYGDGLNWYAYVGNDPVNGRDPSGLLRPDNFDPLKDQSTQLAKFSAENPKAALIIGGAAVLAGAAGVVASGETAVAALGGVAKTVSKLSRKISPSTKPKIKTRITRDGDKAVRITEKDGSFKDISPKRVKEGTPNTHPKAPKGAIKRTKFKDAQPGTKGLKRNPTKEELKTLDDSAGE